MRRTLFVKDVGRLWKNKGELEIHFNMLVLFQVVIEHLNHPLKQKVKI